MLLNGSTPVRQCLILCRYATTMIDQVNARTALITRLIPLSTVRYIYICVRTWDCLWTTVWSGISECQRTYTLQTVFSRLIPRSRSVVIDSSVTVVQLVTHDCTRGVIDPLYHSRHYSRHRQYECDRGINVDCSRRIAGLLRWIGVFWCLLDQLPEKWESGSLQCLMSLWCNMALAPSDTMCQYAAR